MRKHFISFPIRRILLITALCLFCYGLHAQESKPPYPLLSSSTDFAFRVHYGVIYAQTPLIENTAGAHPRGFDFDVSKQLVDKANWDNYRCYPRMGLVLSYFDYNTGVLGKSYSAAYFLEPNFRLGANNSFFVRGAVGLSYLTNPHDSVTNPTNQSYSLHVNFFLTLGVGYNYRLGNHIALSFMASFQHNSNGDIQQPNHGINFPTASLGIKYNLSNNKLPVYPKIKTHDWNKSKPAFDAGVYYCPKSGYKTVGTNQWVNQRKFLVGAYMQVSKQVTSLDAITAMVEVYKDGALESIKQRIGDNSSSVLAGFMLGHEFVFHRIFFSQQLGVYIFKQTSTFSKLYLQSFPEVYHRWGLRYKINTHLYAGFNMLAHNQVADFIDVRLSWRF
jgi:hypothetical protein